MLSARAPASQLHPLLRVPSFYHPFVTPPPSPHPLFEAPNAAKDTKKLEVGGGDMVCCILTCPCTCVRIREHRPDYRAMAENSSALPKPAKLGPFRLARFGKGSLVTPTGLIHAVSRVQHNWFSSLFLMRGVIECSLQNWLCKIGSAKAQPRTTRHLSADNYAYSPPGTLARSIVRTMQYCRFGWLLLR